MEIPQPVRDHLKAMLGSDYHQYLDSFAHSYGQTLRINRLKVKPADIIRRFLLEKRVPWCEEGFYYEGEERLSTSPYYHAGAYYLQEPSAMAPAAFLPLEPGSRILDLCAAPGGKTTALAGRLGDSGILVANDISASRCRALQKNVELAGISRCVITCESPEKLCRRFRNWFDGVLVDAPCSGEGMFRKEPAMMKAWSSKAVEEYSRLQKEITAMAVEMVRPGGYLLYSTCTFSTEEDEGTVSWLLSRFPCLRLCELPLYPGIEKGRDEEEVTSSGPLEYCRRFWPHELDGEGQFAALFQKEEEGQAAGLPVWTGTLQAPAYPSGKTTQKKRRAGRKSRKEEEGREVFSLETLEAFLKEISSCRQEEGIWTSWKNRILVREERVFLLPDGCPDLSGLRVVRSGLYLGDCKRGRFEPSQALAMALRPVEYPRKICLLEEDPRLDRYLRGETIDCQAGEDIADSGYVLVCFGQLPLGWGKTDRGRIKNKYLPGWRKM